MTSPHNSSETKGPSPFPLPSPSEFDGLSEASQQIERLSLRQFSILAWLAHGKTNAEIVKILRLSRNTVEREVSLIFEELGVENRMAAAATFLQWSILNQSNLTAEEE